MTITAAPLLYAQLLDALAQVRRWRHQPDCTCWWSTDKRVSRRLYCSDKEAHHSHNVDRLLDQIRRNSF